jgi:hypothetical protein
MGPAATRVVRGQVGDPAARVLGDIRSRWLTRTHVGPVPEASYIGACLRRTPAGFRPLARPSSAAIPAELPSGEIGAGGIVKEQSQEQLKLPWGSEVSRDSGLMVRSGVLILDEKTHQKAQKTALLTVGSSSHHECRSRVAVIESMCVRYLTGEK